MNNAPININKEYDLICVGGGIMSATLALLAKLMDTNLKVLIFERLESVALESSAAWNNAGTGHSALCELNYCPETENGVDISKAIDICNQFEVSKQFWSFLVAEGFIDDPTTFIKNVPHHSWVTGAENADYLEKRFDKMKEHFMFNTIQFTRALEKMKEWFPLIMEGRTSEEPMAASRIERGCEMNFGALTRRLYSILETEFDTKVQCLHEVLDVDPEMGTEWFVKVENTTTKEIQHFDAEHVFIGAGGGALLLLQKVEIDEKEGYGGFPISGQWLICKNEKVINQHNAKVYSKAGPDDPPMSTPHLDTRFIDGKRELLFGPFAGFSPKFLKEGSNLDLFKSIKFSNLKSMFGAFWHNLPLTKYLLEQVTMAHKDRMDELRKFVKTAKDDDWELLVAGQRVQIIKKSEYEGGELQFGTEVISSKDGSITCLLGASPGASTSVHIMLEVLKKAFPKVMTSEKGMATLDNMVPNWNKELTKETFDAQLKNSENILKITH